MLGFALGSIQDVSGTSAGIYHIFTENNTDDRVQPTNTSLYTFTIEDSKNLGHAGSNFIRTVIGGMVDSYSVSASMGDIVSAEVGYIAQNSTMSSGAITALGATTTKPYMFNNCQLHIPSGTLTDNAKEITFSVNNNLERGFYLNGSRTAKELLPMNRDYELTATLDMQEPNARTLYEDYYIAGSEFNSMLKIEGIAGSCYLVMSGCKMTDMTVPSPLEGTQEQSFTIVPSHVSVEAHDSTVKYNAW